MDSKKCFVLQIGRFYDIFHTLDELHGYLVEVYDADINKLAHDRLAAYHELDLHIEEGVLHEKRSVKIENFLNKNHE